MKLFFLIEELSHLLDEGYGSEVDKVIIGNGVRIKIRTFPASSIEIEELNTGKPIKRKLRKTYFNSKWLVSPGGVSSFMVDNLLMDTRFSKRSTYDKAIAQLKKAVDKATKEEGEHKLRDMMSWEKLAHEDMVNYLEVEPIDANPFTAEGKDFTVSVAWTEFSAYDPEADFQSMDPHYTQYASKSKAAARKMFKLLQLDPNALKKISWSEFGDWMRKNKINYETNFSVWR